MFNQLIKSPVASAMSSDLSPEKNMRSKAWLYSIYVQSPQAYVTNKNVDLEADGSMNKLHVKDTY